MQSVTKKFELFKARLKCKKLGKKESHLQDRVSQQVLDKNLAKNIEMSE